MSDSITALENLKQFFESDFISSVFDFLNSGFFAACAGAFGGAIAANWLAKKNESDRLLRLQLAQCNLATATAATIFQNTINFKAQLADATIRRYRQDKLMFENFVAEKQLGIAKQNLHLEADFQKLSLFQFDASAVERAVFKDCYPTGQVLVASTLLTQSLHGFELAIKERHEQIDHLSPLIGSSEFWPRYFGMELPDGRVDRKLSDAIESIRANLDCSIYHALFISTELGKLGKELAKKLGNEGHAAVTIEGFPSHLNKYLPDPKPFKRFEISDYPRHG